MIKYSIVICSYNRSSMLKETIVSLFTHIKEFTNIELIVVNNNSTDDTESVLKDLSLMFPAINVYIEMSQGLSHARNRGVKESKGSIIIFLDDDVEIDSQWINNITAPFNDNRIGVVGGKVLPFKSVIPTWLPRQYYFLASIFDPKNGSGYRDHVMGANFAVRASCFSDIGTFDVNLGRKGKSLLGGEETDLFERIRANSLKIYYNSNAKVYHKIDEKLNTEYIYEYAYKLGMSSGYSEKINLKNKFILKYISYIFLLPYHYLLSKFQSSRNGRSVFHAIKYNYIYGYFHFYSIGNK